MYGVHSRRIGAGSSCDRFDALAIAIAQDPERIHRKRRSSLVTAENLPNAIEVTFQALLAGWHVESHHALLDHIGDRASIPSGRNFLSDRNDPAIP